MPIRIAYLDHTGEIGGAEQVLLTLIGGLPPEQVEPLLVCGQEGRFSAEARQRQIPTVVVPLPHFASLSVLINHRKFLNPLAILLDFIHVLRSARRVKRYLQSAHVDLVHTNANFAHIYGGVAARWLGIPCIWQFHDLIETERLGGGIALIWRILARLLATCVVGDSKIVVDALAAGSRGRVIYLGVPDAAPIERPALHSDLHLPPDARLVGFIGRIAHVKGLDILAKAAQGVVQADPRVHFVFFGEPMAADAHIKTELVALVEQLKLAEHWHWMGFDKYATARLSELDMLVLPSRRELLPLVLLEAGAAAKPSVASCVGGVPEIVIDGETGLLVTPGDPGELASAILRLVREPQLAVELGRNAQKRINDVFSLSRYCAQFLALYTELNARQS